MNNNREFLTPTFLPDHASSVDFFGSHQRVADAIATVINTSQSTKIIGILGPWGSGKSTIVRLVENKIEERPPEGTHPYFFSYDAWLHQNDPPRRSFLESLIRFLVSKNLTTEHQWKDDLDRLNRRVEDNDITTTPTLTLPGKLIAASLLLTAYGWKLADSTRSFLIADWSVSIAVIGYILISAPLFAGLMAFLWQRRNKSESHDAIFSIFVNKATERVKTKTIRTPDPTAIEFQAVFRRILASIAQPGRSFIFVIDNLDRISETDAIAIWSTIRSFFVDELRAPNDEEAKKSAPTVLLPLDAKAVQRMYGKADSAADLAQSFIDKTFDLIFHVSPPVQSGWHEYLSKRLRDTLPDVTEEELLQATKLYEIWIIENGRGVTPRNINAIVNEIAMLRLQWNSTVQFATLAYYAIRRDEMANNFDAHLTASDPYISRFDERWAEGIAAIHYGVPPDQVLQVLLLPKISTALTTLNVEAFVALSKAVGFAPVLQRAIEEQLDALPQSPEYISGVAGIMAAAAFPDSVRKAEIEKSLRKAFSTAIGWTQITSLSADGINALVSRCPAHELDSFASTLQRSLTNTDQAFAFDDANADGWYRSAVAVLSATQGNITVPGDGLFFLKVIDRAPLISEYLSRFRPNVDKGAVVTQFAGETTALLFKANPHIRMEKLTAIPVKWDWGPLIDAAGSFLEGSSKAEPGISSALELLGRLRTLGPSKALSGRISTLSQGTILDILYAAHSEGRHNTEARALSLIILANPTIQHTTPVGNSEAGRQLATGITATLKDRPGVYDEIDSCLSQYGSFKELINSAGANSEIASTLKVIFEKRLVEDRIGPLTVEDVVARLPSYLSYLNTEGQAKFMNRFASYPTFWQIIEAGELTANKCQLLTHYMKTNSSFAVRSRQVVIDVARQLDTSAWKELLSSYAEPLPTILTATSAETENIKFGEPLLQALQGSFEGALASAGGGSEQTTGWFQLARALDENRHKILLKDIRDRTLSGNSNPGMFSVLTAGGAELLVGGDFASRSDDSTRHIVLPLLERSGESVAWFVLNGPEAKAWVAASDTSTKGYLQERIDTLSETDPSSASEIAAAIGISIPPTEHSEKESRKKAVSKT